MGGSLLALAPTASIAGGELCDRVFPPCPLPSLANKASLHNPAPPPRPLLAGGEKSGDSCPSPLSSQHRWEGTVWWGGTIPPPPHPTAWQIQAEAMAQSHMAVCHTRTWGQEGRMGPLAACLTPDCWLRSGGGPRWVCVTGAMLLPHSCFLALWIVMWL